MADKKISALPASTTPLVGVEVLPIVQDNTTVKVSVDNLTAGKEVSASSYAVTGAVVPANGMFLGAANAVSIATNSAERWTINASGNLNPVGSYGIGTSLAIVNGVVSNTVQAISASTQDSVKLQGRAGGTGSYVSTITPTTLSASRTVTLPDANTTVPVAAQVLTFSGPTAARTITLPDANFTAARTDAAQTFTGDQTINGIIKQRLATDGTVTGWRFIGSYTSAGGGATSTHDVLFDTITGEANAARAYYANVKTAWYGDGSTASGNFEYIGYGTNAYGSYFSIRTVYSGGSAGCSVGLNSISDGIQLQSIKNSANTVSVFFIIELFNLT